MPTNPRNVKDPEPAHPGSTMAGCRLCRFVSGDDEPPGGTVYRTDHWVVVLSARPFGAGTLALLAARHITTVANLRPAEAHELGPLLQRTSLVAAQLVAAEQVYNSLWSHRGGRPDHIHYLVQPVTRESMTALGAVGPALQAAMMTAGETADPDQLTRLAQAARRAFATGA